MLQRDSGLEELNDNDIEALQTDVMRFIAILAFCLLVIFIPLVRSIPERATAPAAVADQRPPAPKTSPGSAATSRHTEELQALKKQLQESQKRLDRLAALEVAVRQRDREIADLRQGLQNRQQEAQELRQRLTQLNRTLAEAEAQSAPARQSATPTRQRRAVPALKHHAATSAPAAPPAAPPAPSPPPASAAAPLPPTSTAPPPASAAPAPQRPAPEVSEPARASAPPEAGPLGPGQSAMAGQDQSPPSESESPPAAPPSAAAPSAAPPPAKSPPSKLPPPARTPVPTPEPRQVEQAPEASAPEPEPRPQRAPQQAEPAPPPPEAPPQPQEERPSEILFASQEALLHLIETGEVDLLLRAQGSVFELETRRGMMTYRSVRTLSGQLYSMPEALVPTAIQQATRTHLSGTPGSPRHYYLKLAPRIQRTLARTIAAHSSGRFIITREGTVTYESYP